MFGQLTPTSIVGGDIARFAHSMAYALRPNLKMPARRGVGEAPQPGTPEWERANLWKTGLVVGGLLLAVGLGAWFFLGAPAPTTYARPTRVSRPPHLRGLHKARRARNF